MACIPISNMKIILVLVFVSVTLIAVDSTSSRHHDPDLKLDIDTLASNPIITLTSMSEVVCAKLEGCYNINSRKVEPDLRVLLRFNITTINIGTVCFRPNSWYLNQCYKHNHGTDTFYKYTIYREHSKEPVTKNKLHYCPAGTTCESDQHDCLKTKGLAPGCVNHLNTDVYCQWVDITHVDYGRYKILIAVNPKKSVQESRYDNNAVKCTLVYFHKDGEKMAVIKDCERCELNGHK